MLKKLILENWKSFRYAELPIDPLTILIGENASGKSNAVEALHFLSRFASGQSLTQISQTAVADGIRGGEQWFARKGCSFFTLKLILSSRQSEQDLLYSVKISTFPELRVEEELLGTCGNGSLFKEVFFQATLVDSLKARSSFFPDRIELSINGEPVGERLNFDTSSSALPSLALMTGTEEKQTLFTYVRDTITTLKGVKNFVPTPSQMRGYSAVSKSLNLDASNISGFLASLSPSLKDEVESSISSYVSRLMTRDVRRVWAETVGRNSTDAMLYGEELWSSESPIEIDARSMSDGTLRFIAVLAALLTYPEGSQLVVEDIDDGFHPSRAKLLLKAIQDLGEKKNIDVLVTTHNPALLDSLEQDYLPFVVVAHRDSQTGESLFTPLDKLESLPKLLASASLGNLVTQGAIERNLGTKAIAS